MDGWNEEREEERGKEHSDTVSDTDIDITVLQLQFARLDRQTY